MHPKENNRGLAKALVFDRSSYRFYLTPLQTQLCTAAKNEEERGSRSPSFMVEDKMKKMKNCSLRVLYYPQDVSEKSAIVLQKCKMQNYFYVNLSNQSKARFQTVSGGSSAGRKAR